MTQDPQISDLVVVAGSRIVILEPSNCDVPILAVWFDKGVDGFRVYVIWRLIKDEQLCDNPPNPAYGPDRPDTERFLQIHSAG